MQKCASSLCILNSAIRIPHPKTIVFMETAHPQTQLPQALALAGERLAFTGTLASMTHKEAHLRAVEAGGVATEHVSRQTTMLVIGEEGWPLEADGQPSVKLQHAERLRAEGLDLRI